jgi:hypothetical protein
MDRKQLLRLALGFTVAGVALMALITNNFDGAMNRSPNRQIPTA